MRADNFDSELPAQARDILKSDEIEVENPHLNVRLGGDLLQFRDRPDREYGSR